MTRSAIAKRAVDLTTCVTLGGVKEKLKFGLDFRKQANCVIHDLREELIDCDYLFLVALIDGCDAPEINWLTLWVKIYRSIFYTHYVRASRLFAREIQPAEQNAFA